MIRFRHLNRRNAMETYLKDSITMGVALLGAVLGIMNTWRSMSANKVRLRVKPAYAVNALHGEIAFSIEVVNLSAFPVTVSEVGITIGGNTTKNGRVPVLEPTMLDGGNWPRRLETRTSVSCYFDPSIFPGSSNNLGRAYARTSCGETRYGNSPALKQLKQIIAD